MFQPLFLISHQFFVSRIYYMISSSKPEIAIPNRTQSSMPPQRTVKKDDGKPAQISEHAQAYRQEQIASLAKAAEKNPELTGARPAFEITKEQKQKLMSALIPLLFFDGRVFFANVGEISCVRERDRSVVLSNRINVNSKDGQPAILCLPSNISFVDFVSKWAPNFAVLYGDPVSNGSSPGDRSSNDSDFSVFSKSPNASPGVGHLKFNKVAINPDRVVGIYAEEGWTTVVEVCGFSYEGKVSSSFFGGKSDMASTMLKDCMPTTNLKIATQIGDALRKLKPDSFDDIAKIIENRDVGFGKRIVHD